MSQVKIYPERDGDGPPLCTDRCLETAKLYNLSSGERQFCESTPVGRPCGVWSFREELADRREREGDTMTDTDKDDPYSETMVGRARAFREAWLGLIDVIARELRVYKALGRLTKIINDPRKEKP